MLDMCARHTHIFNFYEDCMVYHDFLDLLRDRVRLGSDFFDTETHLAGSNSNGAQALTAAQPARSWTAAATSTTTEPERPLAPAR